MKHQNLTLSAITTALLLAACGGGSGDAASEATPLPTPVAAAPSPAPAAAPSPAPTPPPAPEPAPTPIACTAAPIIASETYSLVFKGCDAANVATYYAKDECVRQNSTGLIWQGQMPARSGHLRANDQGKTNYDSTTELQEWKGTTTGPGNTLSLTLDFVVPTAAEVNATTNSIGYKTAVNTTNLCGSGAWRLPTSLELDQLMNYAETPHIDNAWFPNMPKYAVYWTSSPDSSFSYRAYVVSFDDGVAHSIGRERSNYAANYFAPTNVRLVH